MVARCCHGDGRLPWAGGKMLSGLTNHVAALESTVAAEIARFDIDDTVASAALGEHPSALVLGDAAGEERGDENGKDRLAR